MSGHTKLHNPNYVGPGCWFAIHSAAASVTSNEDKIHVIKFIKHLQKHFPCGDCRTHFGNYIEKNPLEMTLNGSLESLFSWTVNFHNSVNFRLNKPQVSFEDARKIYYDDAEFCMKECTKETENKLNTRIVPKDLPGYIF